MPDALMPVDPRSDATDTESLVSRTPYLPVPRSAVPGFLTHPILDSARQEPARP